MVCRVLILIFLCCPLFASKECQEIEGFLQQQEINGYDLFYRLLQYQPSQIAKLHRIKPMVMRRGSTFQELFDILKYKKAVRLSLQRYPGMIPTNPYRPQPEEYDPIFEWKITTIEETFDIPPTIMQATAACYLPLGFYGTDQGFIVEISDKENEIVGAETPYGTIVIIN